MAAEGARGAPTGRGAEPAARSEGGGPRAVAGGGCGYLLPFWSPSRGSRPLQEYFRLVETAGPRGGGVTG